MTDGLRDALDAVAGRLEIDVERARDQVGVRAGRRRRRHRRVASATMLVGAVAVIALVLLIAGGGRTAEPVGVSTSTRATVAPVVYGDVPSRADAAIAYDDARAQVVLFGGFDGASELADTWLWNGRGWSEAHPATAPPARERAAMAYDPTTKSLVLFGGMVQRTHQTSLALDDTWTWDGTTWTQLHPAHEPPWSDGLAMRYDPRSKSVILLTLPSSHPNLALTPDGVGSRGNTPFGTWQWNGSDWRELPTPVAPFFAKGAVFHTNPRLVPLAHGAGLLFYSWSIYTGTCPPPGQCGDGPDPTGTVDSQTYTWDGTRWTEQHPSRAPANAQFVATPGTDAAPVAFTSTGPTWTWTGSTWSESNPHGAVPTGDGFAVYDAADHDVVAYTGQLGTDQAVFGTWTWDGSRWTERSTSVTSVTTTIAPTIAPTTTTTTSTAPSVASVPTTVAPTTTTAPASSSGACAAAQLRLALARDVGSLMQQPAAFFGLTNTSATACTIEGYPVLTLYDAAGGLISSNIQHGGAYQLNDPGPHRIVVAPGQTVYFGFGWTDVNQADGGTQKGCVSIARVRVVVPGGSAALTTAAPLSSLYCPTYGEVTAIAPRSAFTITTP